MSALGSWNSRKEEGVPVLDVGLRVSSEGSSNQVCPLTGQQAPCSSEGGKRTPAILRAAGKMRVSTPSSTANEWEGSKWTGYLTLLVFCARPLVGVMRSTWCRSLVDLQGNGAVSKRSLQRKQLQRRGSTTCPASYRTTAGVTVSSFVTCKSGPVVRRQHFILQTVR